MTRLALGLRALLAVLLAVALAEVDAVRTPVRLPVVARVDAELPTRPKTRADCEDAERPCPWVGCRYHLGVGTSRTTGQVTMRWPGLAEGEIPVDAQTCALDVVEEGAQSQETVAHLMGVTVERIRQIEREAEKNTRENGGDELAEILRQYSEPVPARTSAYQDGCLADVAFEGGNPYHRNREVIEAEEKRGLEVWTDRVLTLARGGIPLASAWTIASALEGVEDVAAEISVDDQEQLEEEHMQTTTQTKGSMNGAGVAPAPPKQTRKTAEELEALAARVLQSLETGHATVRDVAEDLGLERSAARAALNRLASAKRAHVMGEGSGARWVKGAAAKKSAKKRASAKTRRITPAPAQSTTVDATLALELLRAPPARLKLLDRVLSKLAGAR